MQQGCSARPRRAGVRRQRSMRRWGSARIASILCLWGLWAGPVVAADEVPAAPPVSLAQPALDRFGRDLVRARCRRPLSVKRERVPSAHDPRVLDVVWSTVCPGYELATFAPAGARPSGARPMALTLRIAHPGLDAALAVGSTPAAVRERLGPPWSTQGADLIYALHPDRPFDDTLTFRVEAGRVVELAWAWETP